MLRTYAALSCSLSFKLVQAELVKTGAAAFQCFQKIVKIKIIA